MNETFYRSILNHSPIGYAFHEILLDKDGNPYDYRFIEVNPAFEKFTGLSAADILGKTVLEVMPSIAKDPFNWIGTYGNIAINQTSITFESYSESLKSWYKIDAFSPKKHYFITIFSNITKEKEQIRNLNELRSVFSNVIKNAPVPVMIHTDEGKILNISGAWIEKTGYSLEDIPTIDEWTAKAYGLKKNDVKDLIKDRYYVSKPQHVGEFSIKTKSNNQVVWDFYSTYIGKTPDDHRMAMSVGVDVTEERKQKENLIKERLLLQTTLLSVGDGVICTNEKGEVTLINPIAESLTGWGKDEALGMNIEKVFSIYNEISGEPCVNIIEQVVKSGVGQELANHTILKSKDGTKRPIADSAAPIVLSDGTIIGAVLVFRDYTEKYNKQKEIDQLVVDLQRTQLLLQASLNSPSDIIILSLDKEYRYLYFNEAHRQTMELAYNSSVEVGKCIFDYMTKKDDIERIKSRYDKALSGISHTTLEEYGDFDIHVFETIFNPIKNADGEIIGVSAFARDVTERVVSAKRIEENEANLKLILDSTAEGIYDVDLENRCTFVNRSFLELLGYNREDEIIGKNIHELIHYQTEDGIPLENKDCNIEHTVINGQETSIGKSVFWKKDKSPILIEFNASPQFKNAKLIGSIVTFRDITEKARLEKELHSQSELAKEYLNIAEVMLLVLNHNGEITMINKKGCSILGCEEKDVIGKNWFEHFIPHRYVESVKDVFQKVFEKTVKLSTHYENPIVNSLGEERMISWYNSVLYDGYGNWIGILSSGEDITEFRIANNQLIESERRFRNLFEKAPFGYQSLDESGHFLDVNQRWLDLFEYKKEEVVGKWFGDFLVPEMKPHFLRRFEEFKKNGSLHSEFKMKTKTGRLIEVGFDGNIGYNTNHEFSQTHSTVSDITEINIANEKLRESEERYRELINNVDAGIIVYNNDLEIKLFNEMAKNILKRTQDATVDLLESTSEYSFMNADSESLGREEFPANMIAKFKKPLKNYVIRCLRKGENHPIWLSVNGVPLFYEDQTIREIVVSFVDITTDKVKQDEIAYLSNHDYLTGLYNRRYFTEQFNDMDDKNRYPLGVMMLDVNGLKIINDAFGHDTGDIALKKVSDILIDSCRKQDIVCRIGGDEFAIILPEINQDEIDRIRNDIKTKSISEYVENVALSLAAGYEIKTENQTGNLDEILKMAENQMYRHKLTEGISIRNNAIKAILKTLTEKYAEERIHSAKVSMLSRKIGEEMGLSEEDLKELEMAGMYHDIGKISIPDAVLNKPGKLTKEEYEIIKTHPEISYQILRAADEYSDLAIHALYHHERWDGNGYPSGKKGTDIPLFSRIICVVDAYEAMTAQRIYKDKMPQEEAIKEIIRCSGSQFDEHIARIFVEKVLNKHWS